MEEENKQNKYPEEYINKVLCGNCLELMKQLPDNIIDAIVTDPPYGLSFMGKKWDYEVPSVEIWKEALRVLKPGGYLLSFAGTRTQHRMAVNIEDAGFEIRDMIAWVYGSGFPKSLNVGKSVNALETKEWSKINNAIDNIDKRSIIEVWKTNLNNVNNVETLSQKNKTEAGIVIPKNVSVQENVTVNTSQKNLNLSVSFVVKNLKEVQATNTKINTVLKNVEDEIKQSLKLVNSVERLSQDQNLKSLNIFIAEEDAKEGLKENTMVNLKVDEALKTLRGNRKYSNEEIINVLFVAITSVLKHTILNQSKTFQNLDTKSQMECASAINVIITEYTMECLISNTVDILKSKAVDKLQGNEREIIGYQRRGNSVNTDFMSGGNNIDKGNSEWEGWGTALKPALEPITVARKPLSEKTVAKNVLKWGTGGINIDESRIKTEEETRRTVGGFASKSKIFHNDEKYKINTMKTNIPRGRFPANIILDEEAGEMLDEQSGISKSINTTRYNKIKDGSSFYKESGFKPINTTGFEDTGGASRFFYCAKASKSERNAGCEGLPLKEPPGSKRSKPAEGRKNALGAPRANNHPTVKPIKLMKYLVNLISKKKALILDPFTGSGSTLIACKYSNRNYIGFEMNEEYCKIARTRLRQEVL